MEQKTADQTEDRTGRPAMSAPGSALEVFPKDGSLTGSAARGARIAWHQPRRPDLLIEFLHLIQDRYGYLSARHLRALCEEMRLPQAAVYEVATFYSHFDVVKEGEAPPPPTTIRVCDSITCEIKGAEALLAALENETNPSRSARAARPVHGTVRYRACVRDRASPCRSCHCRNPFIAAVAERQARARDSRPIRTLSAYLADGGYSVLQSCRRRRKSFESIAELI